MVFECQNSKVGEGENKRVAFDVFVIYMYNFVDVSINPILGYISLLDFKRLINHLKVVKVGG